MGARQRCRAPFSLGCYFVDLDRDNVQQAAQNGCGATGDARWRDGAVSFFRLWRVGGLLSAAAAEPGKPVPSHQIDLTIHDGDRLVGTPVMQVADGKPATITVDRAGGFSLRVMATAVEMKGRPATDVEMEIKLKREGQWALVATPRVMVQLGGTATFEAPSGNADGNLKVTMRATRMALGSQPPAS